MKQINLPSEEFERLKQAFQDIETAHNGLSTPMECFQVFDVAIKEVWVLMTTIFDFQYLQSDDLRRWLST